MGVKFATLYLLPYVVIGVHEVAPTVNVALSDRSAKSAIISEQVVNRSLKRDRLPIRQVTPKTDVREYFKVPARLAPNQKNDTDCKPPIDVRGRYFA